MRSSAALPANPTILSMCRVPGGWRASKFWCETPHFWQKNTSAARIPAIRTKIPMAGGQLGPGRTRIPMTVAQIPTTRIRIPYAESQKDTIRSQLGATREEIPMNCSRNPTANAEMRMIHAAKFSF